MEIKRVSGERGELYQNHAAHVLVVGRLETQVGVHSRCLPGRPWCASLLGCCALTSLFRVQRSLDALNLLVGSNTEAVERMVVQPGMDGMDAEYGYSGEHGYRWSRCSENDRHGESSAYCTTSQQ